MAKRNIKKEVPVKYQQVACEVKGEKTITVGQTLQIQCLLNDTGSFYEFQNLGGDNAIELKFLDKPALRDKILEQNFTSYKVGGHRFDHLILKIDSKTFAVNPIEFEVKTVITTPSPTPFPLIDPLKLSAPWWWWAMWGVLLLSLSIYAFISYKKWKKHRDEMANQPKAKILTPFEKFKLALQKLESQEYHLKGEYKRFALDLSQIIKKSIGEKFNFPAEDLTTEELFETLTTRQNKFWSASKALIQQSFNQLDQIKFAKTPATAEMCMGLLDAIRQVGEILYGGDQ